MKTAHTPAPWESDSRTHQNATYMQSGHQNENGGWVVCTCWGPDRDANARLIAAAPELLAALAACEQMLSEYRSTGRMTGWDAARDSARAAIAKAKGDR